MTRRLGVITMTAVAAILLTGCSSPSPQDVGTARPEDSPLSQYLSTIYGEQPSDAELGAQNDRVEQAIAVCMAAEGFEYTPRRWQGADDDQFRPDDPEWVAQWGYGVIVNPYEDDPADDPNNAYYASLSAAEQSAYSTAAYGPETTQEQRNDQLTGAAMIPWQQMGCYGQAWHDEEGDDPLDSDASTPLRQAMIAFQANQLDDPEYEQLDADWADCMAQAGHGGFSRQNDARASIESAAQDIYATQTAPDEDSPELDALHEDEVALALDDLDCRTATDYRARALQIQYALERQFIDDHRSELDALAAEVAAEG